MKNIEKTTYQSAAGKTVELYSNTQKDAHVTVVDGDITIYFNGECGGGATSLEAAIKMIGGAL